MNTDRKWGRDMLGIKALLIGSTLTTAGLAQIDPITAGGKLAAQSASGILGIVAVACIIALVKVYNSKEKANDKHNEKLSTLIEKHATIAQKITDGQDASNALMVEVKDSNNNVAHAMEDNAGAVRQLATHCAAVRGMEL